MNENKAIRYLSLAAKAGKLVTGGAEAEEDLRALAEKMRQTKSYGG